MARRKRDPITDSLEKQVAEKIARGVSIAAANIRVGSAKNKASGLGNRTGYAADAAMNTSGATVRAMGKAPLPKGKKGR